MSAVNIGSISMTPIKPSQLRLLLSQTIPAKLPVLISSGPGVGKSDLVGQGAADAGAELLITHPVVADPTDFKGLPWVTDGAAEFLPFGDLQRMIDATKLTVVFIDDFGQAAPAVQAAIMQLLLARQVNGKRISDEVVFVAATNRRTDRAGVQGLLEPVKSRFATSVELRPDVKDWCLWASAAGIEPVLIAFMRFRPGLLCDFQPTADMTNSPCPRSWENVSKILQRCKLPKELLLPVIYGAVGKGAGDEFIAFLRIWEDMVNTDEILANPDKAPIPTEPSVLYAVSTALATRVEKESMGRYCRYLERLIKANRGEFAALSIQQALTRDPKLTNTRGYIQAASGPIGQLLVGG